MYYNEKTCFIPDLKVLYNNIIALTRSFGNMKTCKWRACLSAIIIIVIIIVIIIMKSSSDIDNNTCHYVIQRKVAGFAITLYYHPAIGVCPITHFLIYPSYYILYTRYIRWYITLYTATLYTAYIPGI
jgi:hypothetical protein